MSTRLKVLIGLIGTLSVLVLALIFFLYYLITKSYPVSSGTVNVAGMRSEVRVYRDAYGVPHVFASTEQDAYYAVGYVHAQDRLWQKYSESRRLRLIECSARWDSGNMRRKRFP
jgi:penicillin amidase